MQKLRLGEESRSVNAVLRLQRTRPRCVYRAAAPKLAGRRDLPGARDVHYPRFRSGVTAPPTYLKRERGWMREANNERFVWPNN